MGARRRRGKRPKDPPFRRQGARPLLLALAVLALPLAALGWLLQGDRPGLLPPDEFCAARYAAARTPADTVAVDRTVAAVGRSSGSRYCVEYRIRAGGGDSIPR